MRPAPPPWLDPSSRREPGEVQPRGLERRQKPEEEPRSQGDDEAKASTLGSGTRSTKTGMGSRQPVDGERGPSQRHLGPGVVLYEMITGQRPFKGHYDKAVMYSITNEEPEPPTALRTGVPMELEWIVGKCLAKDADSRYQMRASWRSI